MMHPSAPCMHTKLTRYTVYTTTFTKHPCMRRPSCARPVRLRAPLYMSNPPSMSARPRLPSCFVFGAAGCSGRPNGRAPPLSAPRVLLPGRCCCCGGPAALPACEPPSPPAALEPGMGSRPACTSPLPLLLLAAACGPSCSSLACMMMMRHGRDGIALIPLTTEAAGRVSPRSRGTRILLAVAPTLFPILTSHSPHHAPPFPHSTPSPPTTTLLLGRRLR